MDDFEEVMCALIEKLKERNKESENGGNGMKAIIGAAVVICGVMVFVFGILFGWPIYSVWQQNKAGEAELARRV